jgi:DNA-binding response OmpR family regulator
MARILIADDSRPIRMLLCRTLAIADHESLEAADGNAALACLMRERPDVAILDVIMPGLSGIDVCLAARATPELADIGLIFLTGDATSEIVRTAGADYVFAKPFSPHALLAAIAELTRPNTNATPDNGARPRTRRRRDHALVLR